MLSRSAVSVVVPLCARVYALLNAVSEWSASWPLWRPTGHANDKTSGTPVSAAEAFSPVTDIPRRSSFKVFHYSRSQFHG